MSLFIEQKIARKLYRAFKAADNPIVNIWDSEKNNPVTTETEFMAIVFDLDECWMRPKDGGYIFFVNGNEWDVISDYTLGTVEQIIEPVNDWIDQHN